MSMGKELDVALNYMSDNFMEKISVNDLEWITGVSRFVLARRFQRELGTTPMRWLWVFRVQMGAVMLSKKPHWSCSDVAYHCGFESPAHFSRKFRIIYGNPPGYFRKTSLRSESQSLELLDCSTKLIKRFA